MLEPMCLLDMDGVLADFIGGACKAHGRQSPYKYRDNQGVFEIEKLWGMSAKEFWQPLEYEGFWYSLAKTPDADEIVEAAFSTFGRENVAILSAPAEFRGCIPEKKEWMRVHYPELAKNMLFGSAKRFLAGPNKVLLDDRDKNIESFRDAGGAGIVVPRSWNCEWSRAEGGEAIEYIEDQLNNWLEWWNGTQD